MDTIFALATPPGRSGVAVIRVSGPLAADAIRSLSGQLPAPRVATLRTIRDTAGDPLDRALLLWLPAPNSFTGEDIAEFHLHGSRAVIAAVLSALGGIKGLSPAGPGAFSQQAYRNGKLDLPAAEALLDLIDSDTEQQRRQAIFGMSEFGLSHKASEWRELLIQALALLEASIDFSDEADIAVDTRQVAFLHLSKLREEFAHALARSLFAEQTRGGTIIAVLGPPNAGKSSLVNHLAGRSVAIVSDQPGTTRDLIEVELDLGGHVVRLIDTAGLRDAKDNVEAEGVRRAFARASQAHLAIWLSEAPLPAGLPEGLEVWRVVPKADLRSGEQLGLSVSTRSDEGCSRLLSAITDWLDERLPAAEPALLTRARHRHAISSALSLVEQAIDSDAAYPEMAAENVRSAAASLNELLGNITADDAVDRVFRDFCIGK
jgi:tRNA modification GTPase